MRALTFDEAFWPKVNQNGPLLSPYLGRCWLWLAGTDAKGYGRLQWKDGRSGLAHRALYEVLYNSVPGGLELDHICRNRRCVNPAHLEVVDHTENLRRGAIDWRRHLTHCKRGHPLEPSNVYRRNGRRHCRQCRQEWRTTQRAR